MDPVDIKLLRETLVTLVADVKVSAVHIGTLASGDVASEVVAFLKKSQLPNIVLDPVLAASSGARLLDDTGQKVMVEELLPLTTVLTPNAQEAAVLTGLDVTNIDDMKQAASRLREMGATNVVVTGGHLDVAIDLLSFSDGGIQTFKSERLESNFTHGTGCAFSTSIACHLAQGRPLAEAVLLAKAYVTAAISNGYPVGKGTNPVNHMYRMKNHPGGYTKKFASGRD
jgi:hydroxymethylpyrimidine/phosphomethylpyrimidine kinase